MNQYIIEFIMKKFLIYNEKQEKEGLNDLDTWGECDDVAGP
jgi:hypothetical protein